MVFGNVLKGILLSTASRISMRNIAAPQRHPKSKTKLKPGTPFRHYIGVRPIYKQRGARMERLTEALHATKGKRLVHNLGPTPSFWGRPGKIQKLAAAIRNGTTRYH